MNEQQADSWYEEQKQKLTDRFLAKVERGENRDKAKEEFSRSFKRLHAQYEHEMNDAFLLRKWRAKTIGAEKGWHNVVEFFRG
ncbi:MAG: hypothetical protein AABX51_02270 [Nanoarchaeota archaeon]